MSEKVAKKAQLPEFSKWEIIKSAFLVLFVFLGLFVAIWWLFFSSNDSEVYVIQRVNDDCFNKLLATSEKSPDEWSMKVCISANNGYVDENGKVIHP